MTAPTPLAHLVAEAAAAPLTEPVAWETRLTVLSRPAPGAPPTGSSDTLARRLADTLPRRARGMNEELLRHVRDRAWFPNGERAVSLVDHVTGLATRYLTLNGGDVTLRTDVEDAPWDDGGAQDMTTRALRWRWLSLALPADLLLAACTASKGYDDPPGERVSLATPHLTKVLDAGCAETHLHVGAAVPFDRLWTAWMVRAPDAGALSSDAPFGGGADLEAMLAACAVARLAIAWFLDLPTSNDFATFVSRDLLSFIAQRGWHRDPSVFLGHVTAALARVCGYPSQSGSGASRWALDRVRPRGAPSLLRDVAAADPLSTWLPTAPGVGLPETRLCAKVMRHLLNGGRDDTALAEVFWQYQRVRAQMFRHLVEEPGTSGLDWFSRHFDRISPIRRPLSPTKYAHALRVQSQGVRLKALEARTSPSPRWIDVRNDLRALAAQSIDHQDRSIPAGFEPPEVGLIFHFIKQSLCALKPRDGQRANADPRHCGLGMRFAHYFRERQVEAQAIATTLRRHPELLTLLRGIDVAGREIATPTWVLAPLFRSMRGASDQAAKRLSVLRPQWAVPSLRVTVHAGEDYRRLMEGLRRMHECVEAGMLRTGDRVGHGLAIAVDVARYARTAPLVLQPAEERLDDLLWELDRYRKGDCDAGSARSEHVRAAIEDLGRFLYEDPAPSIEDLLEARRLRQRPEALAALGFPRHLLSRRPPDLRAPYGLLYRYLTDPGVYDRGQREVEVAVTSGEERALTEAQAFLQRTFARLEVTIECNPTSNLLIGDLGDLQTHPVFRLVPIESAAPRFGVPVSINTDNPVTFGSCLGDEFALLHHALLARGEGAAPTIAWIDAARAAGVRSRFTLPASAVRAVLDALRGPTGA